MSEQGQPKTRMLELDALRGIAALGVVIFHYFGVYASLARVDGHELAAAIARFGVYGIHLFFIVSGFVIFMTLERCGSVTTFTWARFSRLFPAYWIGIVVTVVIVYPVAPPHVPLLSWREVAINLTMFQEFLSVRHLDDVYWTLSRELAFYVLMAVVLATRTLHRIEDIAIGWLAIVLVFKLAVMGGLAGGEGRLAVALNADHAPLFIAGMMFYRLHTQGPALSRHLLILATPVLMSLLPYGDVDRTATTVAVATFIATFYLFVAGRLSWLAWRPLVGLGSISYALYLIHNWAGFAVMHRLTAFGIPFYGSAILTIIAGIWVAAVVTYGLERPIYRLLREAPRSLAHHLFGAGRRPKRPALLMPRTREPSQG